jgi:gamma-glutamylcyclotransferase (GGCT)/AIG2-like uncharacterized protein YtfP
MADSTKTRPEIMGEDQDLLFVYGSLRHRNANPMARYLWETGTVAGEGSFPGELYMVSWYPGAVHRPHAVARVHGIILKMKDAMETLKYLDRYEGFGPQFSTPPEFIREFIPIQTENGTAYCWIYLFNQSTDGLEPIEGGVWNP